MFWLLPERVLHTQFDARLSGFRLEPGVFAYGRNHATQNTKLFVLRR